MRYDLEDFVVITPDNFNDKYTNRWMYRSRDGRIEIISTNKSNGFAIKINKSLVKKDDLVSKFNYVFEAINYLNSMDKSIIQTKGYVILSYDVIITKPFKTEQEATNYLQRYAGKEEIYVTSFYGAMEFHLGGRSYPSDNLSIKEVILDNQIFGPDEHTPSYLSIGYGAVMNLWGCLNGDMSYTPKRISPIFSSAQECLEWLRDHNGVKIIRYPGFEDDQEIKSSECTIQMFAL